MYSGIVKWYRSSSGSDFHNSENNEPCILPQFPWQLLEAPSIKERTVVFYGSILDFHVRLGANTSKDA